MQFCSSYEPRKSREVSASAFPSHNILTQFTLGAGIMDLQIAELHMALCLEKSQAWFSAMLSPHISFLSSSTLLICKPKIVLVGYAYIQKSSYFCFHYSGMEIRL